jgi:ribonuclease-3
LENKSFKDYKSLLQELCQRLYHNYPVYILHKRSGPEHARLFWMQVTVADKSYGPGAGRNKKSAEQEAARMAYEDLSSLNPARTSG